MTKKHLFYNAWSWRLRLMSWTISLTFLQRRFDSTAIHLFSTLIWMSRRRKGSVCADKQRNAADCMFQACLRQKCDLHRDLLNESRLNANIVIYRPCATSYFVSIVLLTLSFIVYEIFTVETCIVWPWPIEWIKVKYKYANRKPIFD